MKYKQTFDTISLRLPLNTVKDYKKKAFQPYETPNGIQLLQVTAKTSKHHAVNLIRINPVAEEVVLSMSAKILGKDYPQFINSDTVAQALDRFNATGLLRLDTAAALRTAEPLMLHPARDFRLTQPLPQYLRVFKLLHVNNRYSIQDFRNENSLIFAKRVKTRKAQELAKLYGKDTELELKKNQAFREALGGNDLAQIRQQFKHKTRFELELNSREKIFQYYKLDRSQPLLLSDVLVSPVNPLAEVLHRLRQDMAVRPEAIEEILFLMGLPVNESQVFGTCLAFGLDLDRVKYYYAAKFARVATSRKKFKEAKGLISRYHAQRNNLGDQDFALIEELSVRVSMDI